MPGNAPFGYRYEDGELIEVPDEQATIRLIHDQRAPQPDGKKGLSYGSIAAMLNRKGNTNRGKFWNPTMVWYVVQREKKKGVG